MRKIAHTTISLCIAAIMVLALGAPAFAAQSFAAQDLKVPEGYTVKKVSADISTYGTHYFHDGLIAVRKNNTEGNSWCYLNTKGELVDLGSKAYGFDFSEGMAPFLSNNGVGYMDKTGKIIIPAQFDSLDVHGTVSAGRFINGNALVYKASDAASNRADGQWLQIDKNGKQVPKTLDENTEGVIYSDAAGYSAGVTTEKVLINEKSTNLVFSEGFALLDLNNGTEYYIIGKADAGSSSQPSAAGFSDVPADAWYFDAVNKVKDLGIISGKGSGKFDPSGSLTVAEAITLAAKTRANFNKETLPPAPGDWYAGAVQYAISHGIIKQGEFENYDKPATRAEMAYLFANALPEAEYTKINNITKLPDVTVSTPYQESIFKLYNAGIVSGSDKKGSYKPGSNIQRSEAAAIILRVVEKTERKTLTL